LSEIVNRTLYQKPRSSTETDTVPLHRPCSACYADSAKKVIDLRTEVWWRLFSKKMCIYQMQRIKKHLVWSRLYDVSGRGFKRPPPVNQIQYRHACMLARPASGDTFMWKLSQTLDLNMPPASSDPHALLLLPYANGIYRTSPELNCVDKNVKVAHTRLPSVGFWS